MKCGDKITGKISKLHPDCETCYQDRGLTFAIKVKVIVMALERQAVEGLDNSPQYFFHESLKENGRRLFCQWMSKDT